jgi:hypothetical protein
MLTDREKALWEQEIKNPTGHVLLKCELHSFYPGTPKSEPVLGCKECATADIFYQVATSPPHKREELLDAMEAAIYHMAEAEDRGEETFRAYKTPIIEISHDIN